MKKLLIFAGAVVATVACNQVKELSEPELNVGFTAKIADVETKTTLVNDVYTNWNAEDEISIFGAQGDNYWFKTATGGATAEFTTTATVESGLMTSQPYALYPYDYKAVISNNTITTTIANGQVPQKGDFPTNQKPLLIAKADAQANLAFDHASCVVKFTITDEDITTLYFWGNGSENIAGTTVITAGDVISTVVDGTASNVDTPWAAPSVTVANNAADATADATALGAGTYYFVIAPSEFENGISVQWLPAKEGYTNTKTTEKVVSAKAGHILDLGTIGYNQQPTATVDIEWNTVVLQGTNNTVVNVTASDDTGLASIVCRLYDSSWNNYYGEQTFNVSGTSQTVQYTVDATSLDAGIYDLAVIVTDINGAQSESWTKAKITVNAPSSDAEAPKVEIVSSTSVSLNTDYTLQLKFSDNETGIVQCWPSVSVKYGDYYPSQVGDDPSSGPWGKGYGWWDLSAVSGTETVVSIAMNFSTAGTYTVILESQITDNNNNKLAVDTVVGEITVSESAETSN